MGRVFHVHRGEGHALGLALIFALFSVAIAIMARALGDALLLTTYPLEAIPSFFIASNILLIVIAFAYAALIRARQSHRLNTMLLVGITASMLIGRGLVTGHDGGLTFALCIWLVVAAPLQNIICWNCITDNFESRQARRLFPMISAGATIGAILEGITLAPFVRAWSVDDIFYLRAFFCSLCVLRTTLPTRHPSPPDVPTPPRPHAHPDTRIVIVRRAGRATPSRTPLRRPHSSRAALSSPATNPSRLTL